MLQGYVPCLASSEVGAWTWQLTRQKVGNDLSYHNDSPWMGDTIVTINILGNTKIRLKTDAATGVFGEHERSFTVHEGRSYILSGNSRHHAKHMVEAPVLLNPLLPYMDTLTLDSTPSYWRHLSA